MTDKLTVLSHSRNLLAKTWKADGTITPYDKGKNFSVQQHEVRGVRELSALLTFLEPNPRSCIIRGQLNPTVTDQLVVRRLDVFDDVPLHTILIEVDDFEPVSADPVLDPVGAAEEYIKTALPSAFHGIAYHWQLSNSAGHPSKRHLLKAHLWFWLAQPATSAQLKTWALATGVKCDRSVFNPVQVHYTAAPVFEPGVVDPVPVRSGFVQGPLGDRVVINLADVPVAPVLRKDRSIVTGRSDDSIAQYLHDNDLVLGEGPGGQLYIECPHGDHEPGAVSSTAYFPAGTGGIERGHFKCLHSTCAGRTDVDFEDALGLRMADIETLPTVVDEKGKEPEPLPYMEMTKDGRRLATLPNIEVALRRSDFFGWRLRYDTFFQEVMVAHKGNGMWQPITDGDKVNLRIWLERQFLFKPIGKEMMSDAVEAVAERNTFDTAQHWLENLQWDGVRRIEKFFPYYFQVEDSEYARACGRYIWTAMAGRVLQPGVKADMVPVLVGPQGVGKSTGVRAMVPDDSFFTEIDLSHRDADLARQMRGKLIGEIGELKGMRRAEKEAVKAFISRTHEEWVPKYREHVKVMSRRFVFIGTTNQYEFLEDDTGNRRWLPLVVRQVDVAGIAADRLQLWAEAREMFELIGVDWSAEKLASAAHEEHRVKDEWEGIVSTYLETPADVDGYKPADVPFTGPDLLREALGIDRGKAKRADEMRLASVLRTLGYQSRQTTINGRRAVWWQKSASW